MVKYTLLFVTLFALSIGFSFAQTDGEVLTVRLSENPIRTVDPIFAGDIESQQALHAMYVGLTRVDPTTGALMPALATDWNRTFLPDGNVLWRFTVREDIPWVRYSSELGQVVQMTDASGRPRTVNRFDIAYGILRALNPEFAMENAVELAEQIDNGLAYLNGEVSEDEVGVIVNVRDIAIVATSPAVDVPRLLSEIRVVPQPAWLIDEVGMAWTEFENFVSYGPYTLFSWSDAQMTLVSNPFWLGIDGIPQAHIENLHLVSLPDDDALLAYEAGELDVVTMVAASDIPTARETYGDEFAQYAQRHVQFLGFNFRDNFPSTHEAFRQALAYALNREVLDELIRNAGHIPATALLPPTTLDVPAERFEVLPYDIEQAQIQREVAVSRLGQQSLMVDLIYLNTDYFKAVAEAVAMQWRDELGIEVNLLPQDASGSYSNREFVAVWMGDWFIESPVSQLYFRPLVLGGDLGLASDYANEQLDRLYEDAYGAEPVDNRDDVIMQMEELVLESATIIPLSWSADNELTRPYISRTPTVNGIRAFETWRRTD